VDDDFDPRLRAIGDWARGAASSARGVLVPVSGGSDSALAFWLLARALPGRAFAVHVGAELRARDWFETIGSVFQLPHPDGPGDREALRWAALISHGLNLGHWLVGSRNRTEDVLGTYSLASRVATFLPLVGLWKSEVMELCERVGVPAEILASSRRADPACGRPQGLAEIPFGAMDLFLQVRIGERPEADLAAVNPVQLGYLEKIYQYNQFKKALPLRPPVG
jgi:NH3-dependent NAD+ synthetase